MIIVTGGAGFIGSAFVASLNSHGIKDIIVVDELTSNARANNLAKRSFSSYVGKDEFLASVVNGTLRTDIQAIVHLGACSSTTEKNFEYLKKNNFEYSKILAEYCIARNIRFIYASSAATYGDGSQGYEDDESRLDALAPLNPYGRSKHMMDLWARDSGALTKVAGIKFFNVYGPNEYYKGHMASVAWKAFNTIQQTGAFSLFKSHRPDYKDGEQMRDFVYVKDCCAVMWRLLHTPSVNGLFNIGSGKARSWNSLLTAVFAAMNKPRNITYIDMPRDLRDQYQYFTQAPMHKLQAAGFTHKFHSLEEGITDYVTNYLVKPDQHW